MAGLTQSAVVKLILEHIGGSKIAGAGPGVVVGSQEIIIKSPAISGVISKLQALGKDISSIRSQILQNPQLVAITAATAKIQSLASTVASIPGLLPAQTAQLTAAVTGVLTAADNFALHTGILSGVVPVDPFANLDTGTTKLSGIATGATKNTVTYSTTAPISPTAGDFWTNTTTMPFVHQIYTGAAWQVVSSYVTNTQHITDGANLGATALWTGVTGTGKAADNATVGATWGSNLTGRPTNLSTLGGTEGILNTLVTINADGSLGGAGSGSVLLGAGGLGYLGDLRATAGDSFNTDINFDVTGSPAWTGSPTGIFTRAALTAGAPAAYSYYATAALSTSLGGTSSSSTVAPVWPAAPSGQVYPVGVVAGTSLFVSYFYRAIRTIAGTNGMQINSQIDCANSSAYTSSVLGQTNSYSGADSGWIFVNDQLVIPTGAVSANPFLQAFASPYGAGRAAQHDIYFTGVRFARTSYGATIGAVWGTNLTGRPAELTDGRVAAGLNVTGGIDFTLAAHTNKSLANVDSTASTKLGGVATGATKNITSYSTAAPASPTDGDIWVDTTNAVNPTIRIRIAGAWQISGTVGAVAGVNLTATDLATITPIIGLLRTATTGARVEIGSNLIQVFDSSGTIRVKLGIF